MSGSETVATISTMADETHEAQAKRISSFEARNVKPPPPGKRQRIKQKIRRRSASSPAADKRSNVADSFYDERYLGVPETNQTKFWTSPILLVQYAIVLIALVSKQYWLLQGILFLAGAYIAYIVYQWICYIIDDPDLKRCVVSFRWYLGFACRQAEATFQGGNARRMVEGGFLAYQRASTSFLKYFYRQRSAAVNRVMIQQHEANIERLKQWQTSVASG